MIPVEKGVEGDVSAEISGDGLSGAEPSGYSGSGLTGWDCSDCGFPGIRGAGNEGIRRGADSD